jgi:transcriptional/translational regulatory protein YebC/TACO1
VLTEVDDIGPVRDALVGKGYKIISADPDKIPSTYVTLTDEEQIAKMQKLLDMLDDNEDITGVWHNWDNEE